MGVSEITFLVFFFRCPDLIYLNICYCQAVTDAGIEALVQISSLAYINISGIDITDEVKR